MTKHNYIQERGRAFAGWTEPKWILKNQYLWNQQITQKRLMQPAFAVMFTTATWLLFQQFLYGKLDVLWIRYRVCIIFSTTFALRNSSRVWLGHEAAEHFSNTRRVETHKPQSGCSCRRGGGCPTMTSVWVQWSLHIECVGVHTNYHE